MPVSVQDPINVSVANGVTTVFPYHFLIPSEDAIAVEIDGALQVSGFTVSGVGNPAGGNITFAVAPANGAAVVRYRDLDAKRDFDWTEGGDLLASTHDANDDYAIMLIQQVLEQVSRAPKVHRGGTAVGEIPAVADRANRFWYWGPSGELMVSNGTGTDVGLREDLADEAIGDALIMTKNSVAGAEALNLSAYLNLKVMGLRKTFGAPADGVGDALAAWNKAAALTGKVLEIEDGTFLMSANPDCPRVSEIRGWGITTSTIKAGPAVTKLLSLTGVAPEVTRGFTLLGNTTAGAAGLILGDMSLTNQLELGEIQIHGFTGAGAYGCKLLDIVTANLFKMYIYNNYRNVLSAAGAVSGTPTTWHFWGGGIRSALDVGLYMEAGLNCGIHGTIIENNAKEGVLLRAPDFTNIIGFLIDQETHFEGNCTSNAALFALHVDGSNLTQTTRLTVRDTYFTQAGNKAIRVIGPFVAGFEFDNLQVPNATGAILVTGTPYGRTRLAPHLASAEPLIITDADRVCDDHTSDGVWSAWTPTFTSDAGNAAATFSVAPSGAGLYAYYERSGYKGHIDARFAGTTHAANTPAYIEFTLPPNAWFTTEKANMILPAFITIGGVDEAGSLRSVGVDGTTMRFYRAASAVFPAATAIVLQGIFPIHLSHS